MPSKHLLFHNGLIFTAPAAELSAASLQPALHRYSDASAAASSSSSLPGRFAEALLVRDEAILAVGTLDECRAAAAGNDIRHTDLQGKLLLPSFIDGHTHVTLFGQSMQKLDLAPCTDLASIQAKLLAYRNANPNLDRILAKGWLQKTTHNVALSSMIDDVVSDIPVYIESKDLHSHWHFIECGAPLAIGSDTPTASHLIFPNLYNAVTRRSTRPLERGQGLRTTPEQAIPLATALAAATYGAARSCKAEDATGSLERGKSADFVVVDSDLFASYGDDGGEGLMKAKILQTWFRGRVVFELPN